MRAARKAHSSYFLSDVNHEMDVGLHGWVFTLRYNRSCTKVHYHERALYFNSTFFFSSVVVSLLSGPLSFPNVAVRSNPISLISVAPLFFGCFSAFNIFLQVTHEVSACVLEAFLVHINFTFFFFIKLTSNTSPSILPKTMASFLPLR